MTSTALFAEISALAGDPARASMLHALMDGRALTAGELSRVAGVTPQTTSGHLARLATAGLVSVEQQGRHRYHRLATPSIARMLESIMRVAADLAPVRRRLSVGPRDASLRLARTCYDHLAGTLGVALADALAEQGHVELGPDAGIVTDGGIAFLRQLGVAIDRPSKSRRIACRPCLDWSERRAHLAGSIGAALCARSFEAGWVRRLDGTRAVAITPKGRHVFAERFGAVLP